MASEDVKSGSRGKLLVLDDDSAICEMIGFIAEGEGFSWRSATGPREFFAELTAWQPSHIVLDLLIPEMDGIEVMRNLGVRGCQAGIIIMSGTGSRVVDAARRSAAEHGLNILGVLNKPFLPSVLRECLNVRPAQAVILPGGIEPCRIDVDDLRSSIVERRFELFFQPKIVCATGDLAGYEALVRWNHPSGALVMPDRFIGLAERSGLIDGLTDLILDQAMVWLTSFDGPQAGVPLSVNLSSSSLHDILFADRVAALCSKHGISPTRLIFELTETSAMRDPVTALDLLTRLRLKGFSLSIDDFGTGYSSALQLVRLPFSEMKVDKSFVMTALTSAESRAVIKSIVDLGHSFGMWVTGEGVETIEALEFLCQTGCDLAQGFFIGRPMPAQQAAAWRPDPALRKTRGDATQPSV